MAQTLTVPTPAAVASARAPIDWITPLLVLVFVLSGASGLMYQIAWVKLLALTFGVTIYAVSTVVAAFMGGLALGSFVGGRLADRARAPILGYALVEVLVAALGVKSVDALDWVQSVYVDLYPRDVEQAALQIVALRFVLSAAVVMIPTTLMGATLPLMVRGSLSLGRNLGTRVSWLYASNTGGAILGTLFAGFFLIGAVGVRATILSAASLNTVAAALALLLGLLTWSQQRSAATGVDAIHPDSSRGVQRGTWIRTLVIGAFAVQGFASLAYEVIWTRVFAVLLDGSTYAFSIVLAVVLLGISLGSALISPLLARSPNPPRPSPGGDRPAVPPLAPGHAWVRLYALIQIGVALFGFVGVFALARIYGITSLLAQLPVLSGPLDHFGFAWMAMAAAVIILPVMLLLGASFPVAAQAVVSGRASVGRELGLLYAGNTAGAILGAWGAGFFLLPALGSQHAIELLAAINVLLALALALGSGSLRLTGAFALAALALITASLAGVVPDMYQRMLAGRFPGTEVVWVGEGMESTITIVRRSDTGYLDMYFNGQSQASDNPGVLWFHRLLGHLPMAVARDPQDVLIVGVGGGATASALAAHAPRRLDIVELSEIAMQGAGFYEHVNGRILDFPYVHLRIDDARNYLLLTDRQYDVVTADAIHPRSAGTSLLYSYDYYASINSRLKPGGLMAQWLKDDGSYEDNDALRHLIARSFAAAFPYVSLWANGSLLIGSNEPIDPQDGSIEAHWRDRNLAPLFEELDIRSPDGIKNLFVLNDRQVREWAGEGPLMTDDRPYGEYYRSLPVPELE